MLIDTWEDKSQSPHDGVGRLLQHVNCGFAIRHSGKTLGTMGRSGTTLESKGWLVKTF